MSSRITEFRSPVLAVLLLAAGCRVFSSGTLATPELDRQRSELLRIVPLGTDRQRAVEELLQSGVKGTFGYDKSIYYCDLWERRDGRQWHMTAALYFDEAGRLYKIDSGNASTGLAAPESDAAAPAERRPRPLPLGESPELSSPEIDGTSASGNGRSGRRTPFADDFNLQ